MTITQQDLQKRLRFILHRGFVEARNLALAGAPHQQIADLADAMELLPRFLLKDASEEDFEMIRFVLQNYEKQYPDRAYDYMGYLERNEPPERF